MKSWISTFIIVSVLSLPAWGRPCMSRCHGEDPLIFVRVHKEMISKPEVQCSHSKEMQSKECSQVCGKNSTPKNEPMDFITSFFINPFFTLSFVEPSSC